MTNRTKTFTLLFVKSQLLIIVTVEDSLKLLALKYIHWKKLCIQKHAKQVDS